MKKLLLVVALAASCVAIAGYAATTTTTHPATSHGSMSHDMSSGTPGTWKGELLDAGCFLAHGAKGEKHKECALKCAANGMPLMIMVGDKVVLLTPDHDNADPYNALKTWAGSVVEVSGTMATRSGVSGINVTGSKLLAAK